ncbi:hypothetical protein C2G38_2154654 [Gigaspora rosea]|uniref:Tyrosinase copper-binding domain-containing protein n=1 Tax=Gigaspora rosea TaxID=44941 RepID=A0A397W6J9_9GLOM|nr:hypothetical protein C2G38_2154654 [Gigaspora rosea]
MAPPFHGMIRVEGDAPSVLVGARAGTRDPLFWRCHRQIDNIYKKWQDALDFHHDAPTRILEVDPDGRKDNWLCLANKMFGGDNFDRDLSNSTFVTNELHTKMKNRILVWREDNYDHENITYLYPRDWNTLFAKPAQKTEEQMDSTQITNVTRTQTQGHDEGEIAEMLFCDCGRNEGLNFKLIVFITDGTDDLVPTYDDCGITLLCGAHYWTNKIPDVRPLGYPFDRPFKNNSYKQTFEGLSNAANRDFKIVWTDTDFQEV